MLANNLQHNQQHGQIPNLLKKTSPECFQVLFRNVLSQSSVVLWQVWKQTFLTLLHTFEYCFLGEFAPRMKW